MPGRFDARARIYRSRALVTPAKSGKSCRIYTSGVESGEADEGVPEGRQLVHEFASVSAVGLSPIDGGLRLLLVSGASLPLAAIDDHGHPGLACELAREVGEQSRLVTRHDK
jgi:hypothetical protein